MTDGKHGREIPHIGLQKVFRTLTVPSPDYSVTPTGRVAEMSSPPMARCSSSTEAEVLAEDTVAGRIEIFFRMLFFTSSSSESLQQQ